MLLQKQMGLGSKNYFKGFSRNILSSILYKSWGLGSKTTQYSDKLLK